MKKTIVTILAMMLLTTGAYAENRNGNHGGNNHGDNRHESNRHGDYGRYHHGDISNGVYAASAGLEFVSAILWTMREPTPIYQVPAIIVPRAGYGEQPYVGNFGANYVATYLDATNGLLVVQGNIQIILPNDGQVRTVEQQGNLIYIRNLTTGQVMTVKVN